VRRLLTGILLACASLVSAQGVEPRVTATISPDSVSVGEPAVLTVTILVPTWFAKPPVYPSFELANAIVRRPPDSSYPTSQRIGRETWSGIVRRYEIFPLIAADFRLEDRQVTISTANPGAEPVVTSATVPDLRFTSTVPAGTESLSPYLSGSRLELTLAVEGDTGSLEVGDAVTLKYTAVLDGLPGMFLPPLAPAIDLDGVSVYPEEPRISDDSLATRRERLTLVFDAGGEYSIPAVSLDYWNTAEQSIETVGTAGLVLGVAGPPPESPPADDALPDWRLWTLVAGAMLLAGIAAWRLLPTVLEQRRAARKRWLQSEACAFKALETSLARNDPRAAYDLLLRWLERLDPPTDSHSLAARSGDETLRQDLAALADALFDDQGALPEFGRLKRGLRAARRVLLDDRKTAAAATLPSLNPSKTV